MFVLCVVFYDKNNKNDLQAVLDTAARTVTAAQRISNHIDILCVGGAACTDTSHALARIRGVRTVFYSNAHMYHHALAEPCSVLIASLAVDYTHIITNASADGKNVMPRLAAMLDVMIIPDVIEIIDSQTFKRAIYAGNAIQKVMSNDAKKIITLRVANFEKAESIDQAAPIKDIKPQTHQANGAVAGAEWIEDTFIHKTRPDLAHAKIVVAGGRALGSKEQFALIENLADVLGAAVGASRLAVDLGYAPNDWQIGQTGKIIAPDLYIAVGISGAIQHLAGIQNAKVIVAINQDEQAPILNIADYSLVANLFDTIPELIDYLK